MKAWIEPSGENLALAFAEAQAVVESLEGRLNGWMTVGVNRLIEAELEDSEGPRRLAARLALARRVLVPWPAATFPSLLRRIRAEGVAGRSACFRPLGRPTGSRATAPIAAVARAYVEGGGSIDLERGARRVWLAELSGERWVVAEESGSPAGVTVQERRMPRLPFQRPVSLPPKLGRVAVNLARVRPGDRIVDPFLGTGALMLEAALMGMRVSGGDRDPTMVRGAIENLTAMGCEFERLRAADAGEAWNPLGGGPWDALVTDPPYGRASGSAGEPHDGLVARTLPAWAERVRPGGRIVVVQPGGPDPLPPPWIRVGSIPDRVHRSLTREFRVYERGG
ncbi:MAG: hypothetical protein L3K19_07930 [Thermoplasmata archaeon]|nr:hypothetical protein [Thermoplasmata archaeon]